MVVASRVRLGTVMRLNQETRLCSTTHSWIAALSRLTILATVLPALAVAPLLNARDLSHPKWAASPGSATPGIRSRALANLGDLPLAFEPNRGQTDQAVKYLARGKQYTLFLTSSEAVFALPS